MKAWQTGFVALCIMCSPAAAEEPAFDPREAGARYGQAKGASEVCPNVKVGKNAEILKSRFLEQDAATFNMQAAKVYASWREVKNCVRPQDPNPCRIIIQMSCQAAISEIGPRGSAHLDLLETAGP